MRREVRTEQLLRDIVGRQNEYVANKVRRRLEPIHREWLAHSPLGFIATADAEGRVDVSPKGDPPGFVAEADYFDAMAVQGKRPILALEVDVDEVFFHCAKAFLRAEAWQPETWNPTVLPSIAQIAKAARPEVSQAELDQQYSEEGIRKVLY